MPTIIGQIQNLQRRFIRERKLSYRFWISKKKASERGLEWDLSRAEYYNLVSKPCAFCGLVLFDAGIGLDRVDSDVGYIIGNVVPCCFVCNMMKGTLPNDLFIEKVFTIYERIAGKGTEVRVFVGKKKV